MKRIITLCTIIILSISLVACDALMPTPLPTLEPGLVNTIVAMTIAAGNVPTETPSPTLTPSPTRPTKTPTLSPTPTITFVLVYNSPTASRTPENTIPPRPLAWPDWTAGEVVDLSGTGGEGMGSTKLFKNLVDVRVIVTRLNGVKLRAFPNKATSGRLADRGTILILTGLWNKNRNYNPVWSFVKVKTMDGRTFWVGGDDTGDTSPQASFRFVFTNEGPSETPSLTPQIFFQTLTPIPTP